MPLNVPLSVPGEPNRRYTVHLHRTRYSPDQLEDGARSGLRMVSECFAAKLEQVDVELTENPDGSAEAVARVLCTEDVCAGVAEQYRRDADEDIEAEAARAWAASRLVGLTVELLKLRGQVEKTTPGKTPANMLAALLAVQQERTGDATDHIVMTLDEAAHLLRDNDLFTDRSPQGVRREIEQIVRQNRKQNRQPVGDATTGPAWEPAAALLDADGQPSSTTWTTAPRTDEENA
ncbi:hypothetical protein [Streptomyces hydrogenans]|uniref:hypothetical protein n=1 Tax=Streptomyces hydrogenans TaxID=1873719 RepID=UPI0036E51202